MSTVKPAAMALLSCAYLHFTPTKRWMSAWYRLDAPAVTSPRWAGNVVHDKTQAYEEAMRATGGAQAGQILGIARAYEAAYSPGDWTVVDVANTVWAVACLGPETVAPTEEWCRAWISGPAGLAASLQMLLDTIRPQVSRQREQPFSPAQLVSLSAGTSMWAANPWPSPHDPDVELPAIVKSSAAAYGAPWVNSMQIASVGVALVRLAEALASQRSAGGLMALAVAVRSWYQLSAAAFQRDYMLPEHLPTMIDTATRLARIGGRAGDAAEVWQPSPTWTHTAGLCFHTSRFCFSDDAQDEMISDLCKLGA